jgi:type IV pilus assembly protein PilF
MMVRLIPCFILPILILILVSCGTTSVERNRKQISLLYGQGSAELQRKEYAKAIAHLQEASQLDPKNSKILNNLGMAYYLKGQKDLALGTFRTAAEFDPKNSDLRNNLGSIYLERGMLSEAEKEYRTVLTDLTYEGQARIYYNLALISLRQGNKKEAIANFQSSIKENIDYCPSHYLLGELYEKDYRYQQAYDQYAEGTKGVCFNDPVPHYKQALMLIEMRQVEKAKMKLQMIMEQFPTNRYGQMAQMKLEKLNANSNAKTVNTSLKELPSIPAPKTKGKFESPAF